MDCFENEVAHVLDMKISPLELNVYRKNTHTDQYVNFESYTPWYYKIIWIWSLVIRAKHLCSEDLLPVETHNIKKFASWNRFPKSIKNSIIKQALSQSSRQKQLEDYDFTINLYLN